MNAGLPVETKLVMKIKQPIAFQTLPKIVALLLAKPAPFAVDANLH
jgi:hypothetical protein